MMSFPKKAHESWKACPAFDMVPQIMSRLIPNTFYPEDGRDIFSPFSLPVDKVRVVMLGKSPYPNEYGGKGNATGLAFAVREEGRTFEQWPKSLQIIGTALEEYTGLSPIDKYLVTDLEPWQHQGVLLLNVALTCIKGDPDSHIELWRPFTRAVLQFLDGQSHKLIFYFLGADAQGLSHLVFDLKHYKLSSVHPAYVARSEGKIPFDHKFREIDELYESMYAGKIEWLMPF